MVSARAGGGDRLGVKFRARCIAIQKNEPEWYTDSLTLTHGRHIFKTGAEVLRYQQNRFYGSNNGLFGAFTFSGAYTQQIGVANTGSGVADFLLGVPVDVGKSVAVGWGYRSTRMGFFFQDDFKVRNNLTLNLGLRYEYNTPYVEVYDRQTSYDLSTGNDPTEDSEFDLTIANVEKCGRRKEDIRWVLNTHCHVDHAMADRKFQQLGAEIIVHEADADAVEKGTQVTAFYLLKGLTAFPRCPVGRRFFDGEELELGQQKLRVIHTPGHTPGSVCFLLEVDGKNLLFSGDTVLYDGRLGWQGNPYADNQQYLASLRKLAAFTWNGAAVEWDMLLPGHGAMALDKAYLDVEKARASVEDSLARGKDILSTPYATPEYRKRMYGRP